jgi:hypothetical protein
MFTPFAVTTGSSAWPEIQAELASFGPMICQAAEAYLAEFPHRQRRPDRLSLHLRPDCGTLYIVLAGSGMSRAEIGAVTIPRLEQDYYDLPRTDGAIGNAFGVEHDALTERVRKLIYHVLSLPGAADCLRRLCSRFGLRIVTVEYDDDETEREVSLP